MRDGKLSLYNVQRRQQTKEGKVSPPQSCEMLPVHRPLVASFTAPWVLLQHRNGAYTDGEDMFL